ncbi:hypothetical protein [Chitinilyticum piscinae]|uniref:Uncharacterized protein n=1 Tax=Chitinilyticum piscinae TaxID=2866724 RepID=A0A8J7K984_9NEIS|nr:hypothetical protein [Chitinilyticum piscinae]MBE9610858.1 hypothetical protein [Chitinilyticum piscinae]
MQQKAAIKSVSEFGSITSADARALHKNNFTQYMTSLAWAIIYLPISLWILSISANAFTNGWFDKSLLGHLSTRIGYIIQYLYATISYPWICLFENKDFASSMYETNQSPSLNWWFATTPWVSLNIFFIHKAYKHYICSNTHEVPGYLGEFPLHGYSEVDAEDGEVNWNLPACELILDPRTSCGEGRFIPPVFQVAWYLDYLAKKIPDPDGSKIEHEDYATLHLKKLVDRYIEKYPGIIAAAFRVAYIRDPHGDPRIDIDFPTLCKIFGGPQHESDTEYRKTWFKEILAVTYTPHPLRPNDDPFYRLFKFTATGRQTDQRLLSTRPWANGWIEVEGGDMFTYGTSPFCNTPWRIQRASATVVV